MKLDYELTYQEIQELSNADSISALFAKLGYRTDIRTSQSPGNLGITADGTTRPIKNIELIADQEGLLQVYLFELTNVTVTHIRSLCRTFRNRAGNFLLVLTSDYERLDFILVEKFIPSTQKDSKSIVQQQVNVRPRPLTINRKKPETVHIRVLRRFSYTEADPFAQYDKLLSAYAIADWSEEYFNNRALFSDHYLKERLKQHGEWTEDPKPAFAQLRDIYKSASSRFGNEPEAVLRKDLLEPVFKILGFGYKVGKKSDSSDNEPDYRLFQQDVKEKPLAVCLTYSWGRSLDSKDDQRDKDTPEENPGAVVVSLLERGEAQWAIVTNGRIWRLYSQKTHSRATNYYEIDLEEILAQTGHLANDPALAFRYFWLIFRGKAFELKTITRDGKEDQLCFLDVLLTESEDYAKELGERLKERAFEKIFPYLAEGFITYIRSVSIGKKDLSQEELDVVFKGTLTLLYRLLFLLYAESRGLLPVKEIRGFYEASLTKLKREIAEKADKIEDEVEKKLKKSYREDEYQLYDRLTELFRVIDKGDVSLNVPVYNGGLFITNPDDGEDSDDGQNAKFLNETKVPDRFLARALDLLSRDIDDKRQDLVFIDYKSLGVRQLGSIYEGLLEFKIRIAPEKMAIIKGKKTEEIIPYKEAVKSKKKILKTGRGKDAKERILLKGAIYLENDKKERKATGSYYTPDYIVEYIVEHAVGPVLQEKFEAMRPKLRNAQKERQAFFKKQEALRQKGIKPEPESKANLVGRELVKEVFDIKVLDPAMGSGHFLVEAVDYITDKTIDFLNRFPWNPIAVYLTEMRETILKEMDEQGITVDAKRLTDVNLLKRHVLKRCIYGVDINLMAVELAKVSLWLDCFTLGAPLSFLDHHLRCGNSLIGVEVEEVSDAIKAKGQTSLLFAKDRFAGLMRATNWMRHVGELSDVTSAQVKQSKEEYHKASDALISFKRTLDIYASRWFGNTPIKQVARRKSRDSDRITESRDITVEVICSDEIDPILNNKTDNFHKELLKLSPDDQRILEIAFYVSNKYKFFHWELEFPEVFYEEGNRKDNPGFDVAIGNPPYISVTNIPQEERNYFLADYDTAEGRFDIYLLFIEKTMTLLQSGGRMSFINPVKFCIYANGRKLRDKLLSDYCLDQLLDISQCNDVFEEPSTYPCIVIVCKDVSKENQTVKISKSNMLSAESYINHLNNDVCLWNNTSIEDILQRPEHIISPSVNDRILEMIKNLEKISKPLGYYYDIEQCIRIGSKKARAKLVFSAEVYANLSKNDKKQCFPLLDGENLQRYQIDWNDVWLLYKAKELYNPKSPETLNKKKLLIKRVANRLSCVYEQGVQDKPYYPLNTIYALVPNDDEKYSKLFIQAILNSRLMDWVYKIQFEAISIRGGYVEYRENLKYLPLVTLDIAEIPLDQKNEIDELTRDIILSGKVEAIAHQISKYSKQALYYALISLSNRMLEMNKSKQLEIRSYLNNLEKSLKIISENRQAGIMDIFTGRASLRNYIGDYSSQEDHLSFEDIWKIIKKNSGKIGIKLNSSLEKQLKQDYEKSIEALLPLKGHLVIADQLIDQIVYQLYGLTEQEIAIIEEK